MSHFKRSEVPNQGVSRAMHLLKVLKQGQAFLPASDHFLAGEAFFLHVCPCVQNFLFFKDTGHFVLEAHSFQVWAHLNLSNYICNDLISKSVHILRSWGLRLQHADFWGTHFNAYYSSSGYPVCLTSILFPAAGWGSSPAGKGPQGDCPVQRAGRRGTRLLAKFQIEFEIIFLLSEYRLKQQ